MSKFIEATDGEGYPCMINLDMIERVYKRGWSGAASIYLAGKRLDTDISYNDLVALLEERP